VNLDQLNRQLASGHRLALALEPQLAAVYAQQLRVAARRAAEQFRALAPVRPVVADASDGDTPDWVPPDVDEVLDKKQLDARSEQKAKELHLQAIELATPAVVKQQVPSISFEATSPYAQPLLEQVGTKGVNLGLAARDVVVKVIGDSYSQGLSVPNTAAALQQGIAHLADTTALMQARTDLNGLANGASLQSVQALGDAAPPTKTWLATEDERTRETHSEADGQEVPIDQPFQVGDDLLMYPGDPDGSDAEVINCRCTLVYGDGTGNPDADEIIASADPIEEGTTMDSFAASGDTGLPLSDRARAWDAGEAKARLKSWATTDGKIDFDKLGRGYFWRDTAGPDGPLLGDFKLPFADVINGTLTAVWGGVTAAAQRLSQTEGINAGAVEAKIRPYYTKAAKQYDDATIKAPFAAELEQLADSGCATCSHAYTDHLGTDGPCTMDDCSCNGWMSPSMSAALELGVLTAAAGDPIPWRAVLLTEGELTADGRIIDVGAISWRETPLTLMAMIETDEGHDGAMVAGRIDQISRIPGFFGDERAAIVGEGVFDTGDYGADIARLVADQTLRGVSADLGDVEIQLRPANPPSYPIGDGEFDYDDEDGPEVYPGDGDGDEVIVAYVKGTILGATVCPFPAIGTGSIEIADAITASGSVVIVRTLTAGFDSSESSSSSLTAAAAGAVPVAPPAAWLEDPRFTEPVPLTVTDEGRVFGHVATWGVCHIGNPQGPNVCVTAPRSSSGYGMFHLGELITAEGEAVSVGQVTLETNHAALNMTAKQAERHYADTGTVAAHGRCGEDRFGIWFAGALEPDLPVAKIRKLRASKLSGDWRRVNGRVELIGVLGVNIPGFPIPRPAAQIRASADQHVDPADVMVALVAAGMLGEGKPSEQQLRARAKALAARMLGRDELIALALDGAEIGEAGITAAGVTITVSP
jgi:Phage Mu protein F like protein